MKVSLRALSWATRFFWIIALAFAATCVYSATLIRGNFGEPTMTYTIGGFVIGLPTNMDNRGYYSMANLTVRTIVADAMGNEISDSSTRVQRIAPKEQLTILHNVSLSTDDLTARPGYLFNDSNFLIYGSLRLRYADVIPFELWGNRSIPWGAPLYNFTVGAPSYSFFNTTHLTATAPISFQNHSPCLPVAGAIRTEIFSDAGHQFGRGSNTINVSPGGSYSGQISMIVDAAEATGVGEYRIYVETAAFSYGPFVITYG